MINGHARIQQQQYTPSSRVLNQTDLEVQLEEEDSTELRRTLSRPPSYIPTADLVEQQRQLEILSELGEYYYKQEQKKHYLSKLLFCGSAIDNNLSYKDAILACLEDQFKGILMAFWIIVFIFIGAISVFVPNLPKGSQSLWILLVLYMLVAFILFRLRYQQSIHIDRLERQVLEERQRRRTIQPTRQLPTGYFFEIQYNDKEHTHPYRTLLKPPPIYTKTLHTAASIA